jgi:hypothetical protein
MEELNKDELIDCLKDSKLAEQFDEIVTVPKKYIIEDLSIANDKEFISLINKLEYWMVKKLPDEIYEYIVTFPSITVPLIQKHFIDLYNDHIYFYNLCEWQELEDHIHLNDSTIHVLRKLDLLNIINNKVVVETKKDYLNALKVIEHFEFEDIPWCIYDFISRFGHDLKHIVSYKKDYDFYEKHAKEFRILIRFEDNTDRLKKAKAVKITNLVNYLKHQRSPVKKTKLFAYDEFEVPEKLKYIKTLSGNIHIDSNKDFIHIIKVIKHHEFIIIPNEILEYVKEHKKDCKQIMNRLFMDKTYDNIRSKIGL